MNDRTSNTPGDPVAVPAIETVPALSLDPATTALLIIDMQNDFVDPDGALFVEDAPGTVATIVALRAYARAAGMPVFYSQDWHDEGDPEFAIWGEHARAGTWGAEIVPALAPAADEVVVRKLRYDAFYGTSLDHRLRLLGVDTLVVCGTVANICVHYTAASAALRWYDVVIPKDAVSALHPFDMASSLRQTDWLFAGTVTTSEAILSG